MDWESTSPYDCAECLSGVAVQHWTSTNSDCEVGLCQKCLNQLQKDTNRDSIKSPAFNYASDRQEIYDRDGRREEFARIIDILAWKQLLKQQQRAIALDLVDVECPVV